MGRNYYSEYFEELGRGNTMIGVLTQPDGTELTITTELLDGAQLPPRLQELIDDIETLNDEGETTPRGW